LFYLRRFRKITPASSHIKGMAMLQVFYETSPDVIKEVLPPPLEPGPEPLATLYVATFGSTDFGSPSYREGALFLQSRYGDLLGNYCLAMYVTDDVALIRGREVYGFPKKIAEVDLERDGNRVSGAVSRRGTTILTVEAGLEREIPVENHRSAFGENTFNFKYFINPECTGYDFEPRLVKVSLKEDLTKLEEGTGKILFGRSKEDPLHKIEVREILSVVYKEGDMELPPGEVVGSADPGEFTPYAFFRLK
jgi:acetoacetate decarboxylase